MNDVTRHSKDIHRDDETMARARLFLMKLNHESTTAYGVNGEPVPRVRRRAGYTLRFIVIGKRASQHLDCSVGQCLSLLPPP